MPTMTRSSVPSFSSTISSAMRRSVRSNARASSTVDCFGGAAMVGAIWAIEWLNGSAPKRSRRRGAFDSLACLPTLRRGQSTRERQDGTGTTAQSTSFVSRGSSRRGDGNSLSGRGGGRTVRAIRESRLGAGASLACRPLVECIRAGNDSARRSATAPRGGGYRHQASPLCPRRPAAERDRARRVGCGVKLRRVQWRPAAARSWVRLVARDVATWEASRDSWA